MSNFNFNKIILGGRLTADPELNTTPSGVSVTTFTIAVNRRGSKENGSQADFFQYYGMETDSRIYYAILP